MKARIIIGANYGDESKGTIVARYTKQNNSEDVLNILTNGGAQRGHSILTKDGNITYQHFGSGTYFGADTYYSRFFILNPMQFAKEYLELVVKPTNIYYDRNCRWSTPFDMMSNNIENKLKNAHATCGMGIWNTIKRYRDIGGIAFDVFMSYDIDRKKKYLNSIKAYYEKYLTIPDDIKMIWNSENILIHFIMDCAFFKKHTIQQQLHEVAYDEFIFENGQGLLLSDTGKDTYDTTPSKTGIEYSKTLLKELSIIDMDDQIVEGNEVVAHYVTRPYVTRHGDGEIENQKNRNSISENVLEDRTNHWNEFQGEFRYGSLNIDSLKCRIANDSGNIPYVVELTHCDEMDRVVEFKKYFDKINTYDTPLV